jgi:hypothetical protein
VAGSRGQAPQSSASQPRRQRRSATPAVGSTGSHASPYHEASAGYLLPPQANPSYTLDPRTRAPSVDPRALQQAAGQSMRRSQTSHSRRGSLASSSSHSSTQPSVLLITVWCNINQLMRGRSRPSRQGLRPLKLKEMRGFFKAGRACIPAQCLHSSHVSQVFRAFWTQTTSSNNPFGEMLRFVVAKAHKDHSICLSVGQTVAYTALTNLGPFIRTGVGRRRLQMPAPVITL